MNERLQNLLVNAAILVITGICGTFLNPTFESANRIIGIEDRSSRARPLNWVDLLDMTSDIQKAV